MTPYELVIFNNKMANHFYDFVELKKFSQRVHPPYTKYDLVQLDPMQVEFNYIEVVSGTETYFISKGEWTVLNNTNQKWRYFDTLRTSIKANSSQNYHFIQELPLYQGKMSIDTTWGIDTIEVVAATMREADPIKFEQLWSSLKISEIAKQKEKARAINQRKSKEKQSEGFTLPQQKYLAEELFRIISDKNYFLQLIQGKISADEIDRTGTRLIESLAVFNVDVEELLDKCATHKSEFNYNEKNAAALRRFVVKNSAKDYSSLGLIDDNELVRLASERKSKGSK